MLGRAIASWKGRARRLKRETYAVWLALKDPRTPWYARLVAALVVGYAFSPIDLIPDFIPVVGYLDDLVILPLGIALTIRLLPSEVLADARIQADLAVAGKRPVNRAAAAVVIAIWLLLAVALITIAVRFVKR